MGLSLAAALLGGVGWWTPWLGVPVAILLGVGSAFVVPRSVPTVRAAPALALVLVSLAFAVWAGATHAEQVLPRRDSASNFQAAISLAHNHARVVSIDPQTVGGVDVLALPGVTLASPAFFEVGAATSPAIQPQFVIGPAAVYGVGEWVGGAFVVFWMPALVAGLALLALGLLLSRFVSGWWGVLASALTGLSFPILHIARSTYSEPLALLTLLAGLLALVISQGVESDGDSGPLIRRWGVIAGVLIGGTAFVRIDGLRETILLLVVAGLGLAQGRQWPRPLLVGAAVSTVLAFAAALLLANQYLGSIARSLLPLVALGIAVGALTGAGLWLRRRRGSALPRRYAVRLPLALALVTAAGLVLLASRPLWQVVRQDPNDPGARYVAGMQARQGLAIDGGRTYAEHSVAWLSWWVGPVTLLLAAVALVVLVHRASRAWVAGEVLPSWTAPLLLATGSTLLTLWRPGITPDHPWAERRLVIAIPLVLVLAVMALRWLWSAPIRRSSEDNTPTQPHGIRHVLLARLSGRPWRWALALISGLLVVVPTALGTAPLASARVETGSLAAVGRVCDALEPGDVVLMVDSRAGNEWTQVVRGQCGVPTLATTSALRKDPAALAETIGTIEHRVTAGSGRLVLLSAEDDGPPTGLPSALTWRVVTEAVVGESEHSLERRPDRLDPLRIVVRLAPVTPAKS